MSEKKTADDHLFEATEVGNYTVRPLTFGQLSSVTPLLLPLFDKVGDLIPDPRAVTSSDIVKVIFTVLPDLTPVIAKVLDVPEQEIADLDAATGVRLATAIWQLNQGVLHDFFGIAGGLGMTR